MQLTKIPEPLITKFSKSKDIFEADCTPSYSVKIRLKTNSHNGIFINLPMIKAQANYLNPNWEKVHPPKDCDGIIIDLDSKIIYIIELKKSKKSSTSEEIQEQLEAGENWLNHIAFCISLDISIFKIIKVVAVVLGNRSRKREYPIGDKGYYRVNGDCINCEYFLC